MSTLKAASKAVVSDAASQHVYGNLNLGASAVAFAAFAYQQFVKQANMVSYMNTANNVAFGAMVAVAFASTMQLVKQFTTEAADTTKTERVSRVGTHASFAGAAGVAITAWALQGQNLLNLSNPMHVALLSTLAGGTFGLSVNAGDRFRHAESKGERVLSGLELAAGAGGLAYVGFQLFNLEDKGFNAPNWTGDALGYQGLGVAALFAARVLAPYAAPVAQALASAATSCRNAVFNRKDPALEGGKSPLLVVPAAADDDDDDVEAARRSTTPVTPM